MKDRSIMDQFNSLSQMLKARAADADKIGQAGNILYWNQNGNLVEQTLASLFDQAQRIAAGLLDAGVKPGSPLPLVFERPADFYPAFWACQCGGFIPVPLPAPIGPGKVDLQRKLINVWEKLEGPKVIISQDIPPIKGLEQQFIYLESLKESSQLFFNQEVKPQDPALIQYSSGSTSAPKGVLLSQENILANLHQMQTRSNMDEKDVELSWIPHYHDLGMVGCHLLPLYSNCRQIKMTPAQFLRNPQNWLNLASQNRATMLSVTNTALHYIVNQIKDIDHNNWDLSFVEIFVVGAEVINLKVLKKFSQRFSAVGFRRQAILPCYGLAEASVGVSFAARGKGFHYHSLLKEPLQRRGEVIEVTEEAVSKHQADQVAGDEINGAEEEEIQVVSVGPLLDGCQVKIVDQENRDVVGDGTGEILVKGPNISAGYFQDANATLQTRYNGWLRTGDIGFIKEGRLAICGRIKEMINFAGRNVFPQDLEEVANRVEGVHLSVACSTAQAGEIDGEEILVFICPEPEGVDHVQLPFKVKRRLQGELGITIQQVFLIDNRKIPRTSSGKIRRYVLAKKYLDSQNNKSILPDHFPSQRDAKDAETFIIKKRAKIESMKKEDTRYTETVDIAVIGVACRFPQASTPEDFWNNLASGADLIEDIPKGRFSDGTIDQLDCKWGSFLTDPYSFDNSFFSVDVEEARVMDPQQRVLLELGLELLETSFHGEKRRQNQSIGVYIGSNQVPYQELLTTPLHRQEAFARLAKSSIFNSLDQDTRQQFKQEMERISSTPSLHPLLLVDNLLNMLASRLSHELNITGPSMAIDTACSSSMVTIHLAIQSLLTRECDLAIAGGINLNLTPVAHRYFGQAGALSKTGKSRPFSRKADGFVPGEGAGLVLLKPLSRALAEGDHIWGVIKGSAINNDGRSVGAMAPHLPGQVAVLEKAYANSNIDPATISAIEAHGTGTPLGDPIELRSLSKFFSGQPQNSIPIGSVKSNIGHLLGAAGVASFIKMLLCLKHQILPPSLHCSVEDFQLKDLKTPLRIQTDLEKWRGSAPLRAGINSFGFGGTNCHLVLEEAPVRTLKPAISSWPYHLFTLSAPDREHLQGYAQSMAEQDIPISIEDLCSQMAKGRTGFSQRTALPLEAVCEQEDISESLKQLAGVLDQESERKDCSSSVAVSRQTPGSAANYQWICGDGVDQRRVLRVAFLFPGQGAQFLGQGSGFFKYLPSFNQYFQQLCGYSHLQDTLLDSCINLDAIAQQIKQTSISQPLLVAFQVAMAQMLIELGIKPAYVLGHSVGEISAAAVGGALDAKTAMKIAEKRGQLMQDLPEAGQMMAVFANHDQLSPIVEPFSQRVSIAAYNSANQLVLSGGEKELAQIAQLLSQQKIRYKKLEVSHAFHSPLMEPMLEDFDRFLQQVEGIGSLQTPLVSTVKAELCSQDELNQTYWCRHISKPVQFTQAFSRLTQEKADIFLEIGPGITLTSLCRSLLSGKDRNRSFFLSRAPGSSAQEEPAVREAKVQAEQLKQFLSVLGSLWTQGFNLNWTPILPSQPINSFSIPSIPFLGRQYKTEFLQDEDLMLAEEAQGEGIQIGGQEFLSTQKSPSGEERIQSLLHQIEWQAAPESSSGSFSEGAWLIMADQQGLAQVLAHQIKGDGHPHREVFALFQGDAFIRDSEYTFILDPKNSDHFRWLISSLGPLKIAGVIYLGNFGPMKFSSSDQDYSQLTEDISRLRSFLKGVISAQLKAPLHIVTANSCITGQEKHLSQDIYSSMIWSLANSAIAEQPELTGQVIDLEVNWEELQLEKAAVQIKEGLKNRSFAPAAIRDSGNLTPVVTSLPIGTGQSDFFQTSPKSVYLILGGSGGVGFYLAKYLARQVDNPVLILTGRRSAEEMGANLEELQKLGAQPEYFQVDILDFQALQGLIAKLFQKYGKIQGVFQGAGLISAGSLLKKDLSEIEKVIKPKVLGTLNLEAALTNRDYGFVLLISSISGAFTQLSARFSKGMADYGAANAFLNIFAGRKKSQGKPWFSLAWSLWQKVGMIATMDESKVKEIFNIHPLLPQDAVQCLPLALASGHWLSLALDPRDLKEDPASSFLQDDIISTVGPPSSPAVSTEGSTFSSPALSPPLVKKTSELVVDTSSGELAVQKDKLISSGSIEDLVRQMLADALDLTPDQIDADVPLFNLGINSLTAVDMVKELEKELGVTLDNTLLFEYDTVSKLTAYLNELAQESPVKEIPLPLLPAQKTFFANQSFYPHMPCYVFMRIQITGAISLENLEQANEQLFQRHQVLQNIFLWEQGELIQRKGGFSVPEIESLDLCTKDSAEQNQFLDNLETQVLNRVFDLEKGPLYRIILCRLAPNQYCLMFNIHHIVADAWSAQIMVSELLEIHRRFEQGRNHLLPALQSNFTSCAAAIENSARSQDGERSRQYWKEVLQNPPGALALPFDSDPLAEPTGPCSIHLQILDKETSAALALLTSQMGISSLHLIFASYLLLLNKLSGEKDIVIRVANARREARVTDITRVVGSFADSLPVRIKLEKDITLPDLFQLVKQEITRAQRFPLTSSLEIAGIYGDRKSQGPRGVTPAGLSWPDFPSASNFGSLKVESMRGGSASGFTQLGLIGWEFSGCLHFSWNYTESLFKKTTIQQLARQHQDLLKKIIQSRGQGSIGDYGRFLSSQSTLQPSLETQPEQLSSGEVIHQRIFDKIGQIPEDTAVVTAQETISYEELGKRAKSLAQALIDQGVKPKDMVGILASPGVEAIVGILAILASGATYTPIDPEYPDQRIVNMVSHSEVKVVLTQGRQLTRMASLYQDTQITQIILLDNDGLEQPDSIDQPLLTWSQVLDIYPTEDLSDLPRVSPEDIAYGMYTSGTTGKPKCVLVSHRAASIFHDWVQQAFSITAQDRFIQTSSISFGGSIRQIFSPLLAGATVYPVGKDITRDPDRLVNFLEQNRITIWNSVPTLLMSLLDYVDILNSQQRKVNLDHLRWVLIGGEQVLAEQIRRWLDRFGFSHRIANLYGSTETVVNAIWYEVKGPPRDNETQVPIGKARLGSKIYLINPDGVLCSPGEIGEIYVGGESLASGYLADEQLTKTAFVSVPGIEGRLYKTGDLAKANPKGDLIFLGRNDDQVKIRGNRVELSEIEATLLSNAQVRSAAVLEYRDGKRQWLVAFVEPVSPDSGLDLAENLLNFLQKQLPDFMIPHRLQVVSEIPLTGAQKIDRHSLVKQFIASVIQKSSGVNRSFREKLMAIWQDLLGLAQIDDQEDFFSLGGDSILALDMLQRLRGQVPVLPRPITLYNKRTIAALAEHLEFLARQKESGEESSIENQAQIEPPAHHPEESFDLTPSQAGFLLSQRLKPDSCPKWCAIIPVKGKIDRPLFMQVLSRLLDRHSMLRAIFVKEGVKTKQKIIAMESIDSDQILPFIDLRPQMAGNSSEQQMEIIEQYFINLKKKIFDPETWPLFKMQMICAQDDQYYWLIAVHHIIGDGWSLHLLGSELLQLYDKLNKEREKEVSGQLTPLVSSYRDVVSYYQQNRQQASKESSQYWQERYAQPWPKVTLYPPDFQDNLPDGPDARTRSFSSAHIFSKAETRALRQLAIAHRQSLFICMLTLLFRILQKRADIADQIVGIATSGRDLPIDDINRIFGCFTAGLPIRCLIKGEDFNQDLAAVAEAFTGAMEHGDLSSEQMAQKIKRHPGSPYPPGSDFFMSFMDFTSLPAMVSETLQIEWNQCVFHYSAGATDTQLSLNVMAGDQLRFNLHSSLPEDLHRLIMEESKQAVYHLVEVEPAEKLEEQKKSTPLKSKKGLKTAIDAALICYLPPEKSMQQILAKMGLSHLPASKMVDMFFSDQMPQLVESIDTRLGVSGSIFLPFFADHLSKLGQKTLVRHIVKGISLAKDLGARVVSLAGLLPSYTGYGFSVLEQLSMPLDMSRQDKLDRESAPLLTTGHGSTVVAMAKTILGLLDRLELSPSNLQIGVIGFGSIGRSTMELLLNLSLNPASITIFEREQQVKYIEKGLGTFKSLYSGPIEIIPVQDRLPDRVNQCDLLIGASSSGQILAVDQLKPSMLLVDDSFPSIVNLDMAKNRVAKQQDLIISGGGMLDVGDFKREFFMGNLPGKSNLEKILDSNLAPYLKGVAGCRMESLLIADDMELSCIHGLVDGQVALNYWKKISILGIEASPLHIGDYQISSETVERVKETVNHGVTYV